MKKVVYIGYIGYIGIINNIHTYKFGWTNNIFRRNNEHIVDYGYFELLFCIECDENIMLENKLKSQKSIAKRRFSHKFMINNEEKTKTELIYLDDKFTIKHFENMLRKLKVEIDYSTNKVKIEEEKTKQAEELTKQAEELTKQKLAEELTKQKQIELEILKIKKSVKIEEETNLESINDQINSEIINTYNQYLRYYINENEDDKEVKKRNERFLEIYDKIEEYGSIQLRKILYELKCQTSYEPGCNTCTTLKKRIIHRLFELVSELRKCNNCHNFKHLYRDFRKLNNPYKDYVIYDCFDCELEKYKTSRLSNKVPVSKNKNMKFCNQCCIEKNINQFKTNTKCKDCENHIRCCKKHTNIVKKAMKIQRIDL